MSERLTEPIIRTRINHTTTQKNGWVCSETTVELTAPIPDDVSGRAFSPVLRGMLQQAYDDGVAEARRRNHAEGR